MAMIMEILQVVPCPTTELSYTNKAVLNPAAMLAQFEHIAIRYPDKGDRKFEAFVFSVVTDKGVEKNKIAFNASGRKWASLMINSVVEGAPYKFEPSQCLNTITFDVDFANRSTANKSLTFDSEDMAKQFSSQFTNQAFTDGQLIGFAYVPKSSSVKTIFELKVRSLKPLNMNIADVDSQSVEIGLTTGNTIYTFERAEGSEVLLTGGMTNQQAAPGLFNQDWDFAKMGIGGLSEQFNKLFRRAFLSRLLPPHLAEKVGMEHVRGILLYGPPGTGKTLIARQIGKLLLAREPKVVNGPEVLNKYVGESEANIRKLFAEAEEEQRKLGLNSGLHLIIFDEIDAICKTRGQSASSSGVGDNVINQLLSKIDGVDSLHNVLVIGMTNRRDLIDPAILRPGRFELQIEVGLPNEEGRLEIFNIHTQKLRENNVLDASVDLKELAERSKNYTGAEIKALIMAALSYATNRVVKIDVKGIDKEAFESIKVKKADFDFAMAHDVKPALGAAEDVLKELALPIIEWSPLIGLIQSRLSTIVDSAPREKANRPEFVLLFGKPKSGLTSLAANVAVNTKYPFIRVYQPDASGKSELEKVQHMWSLFNDAARSELSCLIVDDLDQILDYCEIGPRFSNSMRLAFLAKQRLILPRGNRMLVVCTCNHERALNDLQLMKMFKAKIIVPSLTKPEEIESVLTQLSESGDNPFDLRQCKELVKELRSLTFRMGIKDLMDLIDSSRDDDESERVREFIERMQSLDLIEKVPYEFDRCN